MSKGFSQKGAERKLGGDPKNFYLQNVKGGDKKKV